MANDVQAASVDRDATWALAFRTKIKAFRYKFRPKGLQPESKTYRYVHGKWIRVGSLFVVLPSFVKTGSTIALRQTASRSGSPLSARTRLKRSSDSSRRASLVAQLLPPPKKPSVHTSTRRGRTRRTLARRTSRRMLRARRPRHMPQSGKPRTRSIQPSRRRTKLIQKKHSPMPSKQTCMLVRRRRPRLSRHTLVKCRWQCGHQSFRTLTIPFADSCH